MVRRVPGKTVLIRGLAILFLGILLSLLYQSSQTVLEVLPLGGLGNRLRVIVSALQVAKQRSISRVTIVWMNSHRECKAKLSDVIDLTQLPSWVSVRETEDSSTSFLESWPRQKPETPLNTLRISSEYAFLPRKGGELVQQRGILREVIRPSTQVRAIVKDQEGFHPQPSEVGIHIRWKGTESEFLSSMKQYPSQTRFFVAAFDDSIRNRLANEFPGRIDSLKGSPQRDSVRGIQEAMAEMILLSRCSEILGSTYSSFSQMASDWKGATIRQMGEKPSVDTMKQSDLNMQKS